ncbi:MAG: calcium/sodium antiporter [Muribaculaceae bacterium]|nr:calcium/sodium antiporter [Muribaculaceae bacterium]
MILNIVFLILGLVLILVGANALTDGASALAKKWGMSDLVVGLTVVAFGTSAPELVISVMSAVNGNAGLAIGNVVGSNIFNVCAIVGITALVTPIKVSKGIMRADIPLVILSALVLLVMGNSSLLDGNGENILTRVDGIILLLFFVIFMYHTFSSANEPEAGAASGEENAPIKMMPLWKSVLWVVGGLAGLIYGGDRFVAGASGLASGLGVSDAVIGLTIVAAGTSLPELATSITAALKGKTGIAIGNVIGSNIFNIFLVLGCSATVRQLPFGSVGNVDLLVLTATSLLFWIFGYVYKERTISRPEGALLLACYIGYMIWIVTAA